MLDAAPGTFVSEKVAAAATPVTLAVTVNDPAVLLAVKVGAVAVPWLSVVAVAAFPPLANVPLAPLAGAVKVTTAPLTALPPASFTAAFRLPNTVLIVTFCGVPEMAVMLAGDTITPVPDKARVWGAPGALSPMFRIALRLPTADGVKVTFTVVWFPGSTVTGKLAAV
jgi:hypothetical protein